MKSLVSLLVISAVALTGCGRQDTASSTADSGAASGATATRASTSATNASAIQPAGNNWMELRTYTFERRGDFNSQLNAMNARIESEVSELRASVSEANASASRRAALEEVQSAKSEFDEKSAALAQATEDTWNQARDEAAAAWDRLQAAIAKARAEN